MQQVYIPKVLFVVVAIATGTVKFIIILVLLIAFLLAFGIEPALSWLALPVVFVVQLMLISGISALAALGVPFLPDLRIVISNVLLLMLFVSGVFYMALDVPEQIRGYFFLNPMAVLIDAMRNTLVYGHFPDWIALLWVLAASSVSLGMALKLFSRYDLTFPKLGP